ncbi:transmembrane protein [Cryptosporidium ryanae]|uniref:uncharacterized protein n=1 Tax=Cryptosporidium ryanae TaxID=515981 RepID=UPI00351A71D3|nr:transmembrane protein [Cryptosporidium ryanae]
MIFIALFLLNSLLNFSIFSLGKEIEKTNGIDPDLFDGPLTLKQQELKMSVCLGLTQSDFVKERTMYQNMAELIVYKNKVSFSDALKSIFHQKLVTCYFNSKIQDINSAINGSISENEINRIFSINNEIPNKFSKKQLDVLEKVISSNIGKVNEKNNNKASSLVRKLLYLIFIVLTIGLLFYFAINRLKFEMNRVTQRKKGK